MAFVDPDNILDDLHKALCEHKCVALTGMGGIGKTTIANYYADEYKRKIFYKDCITINAQSVERLLENFYLSVMNFSSVASEVKNVKEAKEAKDKEREERFLIILRDRVLEILQKREYESPELPYLLIYEGFNYVDEIIKEFFSIGNLEYHVLFTSHVDEFLITDVHVLPVPLMTNNNAIKLLLQDSGLNVTAIETISKEEGEAAYSLAVEFAGRLPLAIHAIGNRIGNRIRQRRNVNYLNNPFSVFLKELQSNSDTLEEVLTYESKLCNLENKTVHQCLFNTFNSCFVSATDPDKYPNGLSYAIHDLALLLTQFEAQNFPIEYIKSASVNNLLGTSLQSYLSNKDGSIDEILRILDDESLIEWKLSDDHKAYVFMHRMIQEVLKFNRPQETLEKTLISAKSCLNHALKNILLEDNQVDYNILYHHALKICKTATDLMNYPNLEMFKADNEVRIALTTGNWSTVFLNPGEEEPSYSTFRTIESEEWMSMFKRIIASIELAVPNVLEMRRCFSCIYFLAHYWWDSYFEEKDEENEEKVLQLVEPLVKAWETHHKSEQDRIFVANLRLFQTSYPAYHNYEGRKFLMSNWKNVYQSLSKSCNILEINLLNIDPSPDSNESSSYNYLCGILSYYYAEALRYSNIKPNYRSNYPNQREQFWRLYSNSKQFFTNIKDSYHYCWALSEESVARLEAGIYFAVQARKKFSFSNQNPQEYFNKSEELAKEALDIATGFKKPSWSQNNNEDLGTPSETDNNDKKHECDVDSELISETYLILADIRWEDKSRRHTSWGYYCAAILCGYAYLESQQDEYARLYFDQLSSRLLDRIMELPTNSDNDLISRTMVCQFIQNFWSEYWKAHVLDIPDFRQHLSDSNRDELKKALFPWTPTLADIKNPQSPCRRCLFAVLENMPEVIEQMHNLMHPYKFIDVSRLFREESRKINAHCIEWKLPGHTDLILRKLRKEDIDNLQDIAIRAFGDVRDGNLVKSILHTHCQTSRTIPLDAVQHTLLPNQYYVLSLSGIIIGLSGLYRTVWTSNTVFSLAWFFIEHDQQRKGYGKSLLTATMEIARKHGATQLMVEASPTLTGASELFEKLGFQQVAEVPDFYAPRHNLLLWMRDLTDIVVNESIPEGLKDDHLYQT